MKTQKWVEAQRRRRINRIGQNFGRLTVIASASSLPGGRTRWLCQCDCGKEKIIPSAALTIGSTKSCGCLGRERRIARNTKHGQAKRSGRTTEWMWNAAKQRAKRQGCEFSLKLEDVVIPKYCPIFGIELCTRTQKDHDNSPSIDRKNPFLGYTLDNIWIISHRANRIKSDATLRELEAIARALRTINA